MLWYPLYPVAQSTRHEVFCPRTIHSDAYMRPNTLLSFKTQPHTHVLYVCQPKQHTCSQHLALHVNAATMHQPCYTVYINLYTQGGIETIIIYIVLEFHYRYLLLAYKVPCTSKLLKLKVYVSNLFVVKAICM